MFKLVKNKRLQSARFKEKKCQGNSWMVTKGLLLNFTSTRRLSHCLSKVPLYITFCCQNVTFQPSVWGVQGNLRLQGVLLGKKCLGDCLLPTSHTLPTLEHTKFCSSIPIPIGLEPTRFSNVMNSLGL